MDKKEKTKKIFKYVILILILIITFLILRDTYSKYVNDAEATISKQLGQWVIKVNDTDISTSDTFSITDFTWEITSDSLSANTVVDGKICPGMKGTFYIAIDPTGTDTSLEYNIYMDFAELEETNLMYNVTLEGDKDGFKVTPVKDTVRTLKFTRIKTLADEVKSENEDTRIDKIKVEIEWLDNDNTSEEDTALAMQSYGDGADITIPITVDVIQYTGSSDENTTNTESTSENVTDGAEVEIDPTDDENTTNTGE